jgi:hypothetical protein
LTQINEGSANLDAGSQGGGALRVRRTRAAQNGGNKGSPKQGMPGSALTWRFLPLQKNIALTRRYRDLLAPSACSATNVCRWTRSEIKGFRQESRP